MSENLEEATPLIKNIDKKHPDLNENRNKTILLTEIIQRSSPYLRKLILNGIEIKNFGDGNSLKTLILSRTNIVSTENLYRFLIELININILNLSYINIDINY